MCSSVAAAPLNLIAKSGIANSLVAIIFSPGACGCFELLIPAVKVVKPQRPGPKGLLPNNRAINGSISNEELSLS